MQTVAILLRRFRRSDHGTSAIEFALIMPALVVLVGAGLVLFLLSQGANRAESATFTIADILSRKSTVNKTFLDTTYDMFVKMLPAASSEVTFRVSSIRKTKGTLAVDWSYPVAPLKALSDPAAIAANLPDIADSDSLIVVETGVAYVPAAGLIGIAAGSHVNVAATRPRFTASITYEN
ncbi:TadE/TadG family type IV pilus assembly protein [Methylobacterium sp. ID0610]|uniref:TadE/TadG family type IV pilus assembly protein n=1 Tax=Methylobacterium carpenticola TaxID=3344827 RepID=UPI003679967C